VAEALVLPQHDLLWQWPGLAEMSHPLHQSQRAESEGIQKYYDQIQARYYGSKSYFHVSI